MKKILPIIPITIALAIFFYPINSNPNSTGSIGGKTGSPMDGASCTACHYAGLGNDASITTNIPASGYVPNETYTITTNILQAGIDNYGFEITSEEANFGSAKTGTFFVTNSNETKLVNNNTAITHKLAGTTAINNMKSWSMDWEAPNTGTGNITFYAAFIAANADGTSGGDTYHSTTLSVSEGAISNTEDIYSENNIIFNSINKTIESINNSELSIYNLEGKLILSSNKKHTNLRDLSKGTYIIKSGETTKKIILN